MNRIISIKPILISSDYGENKSLGQPLGLKTIGIVQVKLEDGTYGYGESYVAIYVPELFKTFVNIIEKKLINKTFKDPRDIYRSFYIPFCSRNGIFSSIYSSIDIALWDIVCKKSNKTLSEFIGVEKNKNLNLYFSGGSAALNTAEIKNEISNVDRKIFKGYKLRIGKSSWENDIKRIETAKSLWDGFLMVDAIMGTIRPPLKINDWESKIKNLDRFNLTWLEEPIDPSDINNLKDLKNLAPSIPIALGESLTGELEMRAYLSNPFLDYLQLDVTHCGGISMLVNLLPEIKKSNKKLTMHVWGSPLAFCANFQFASLIENVEWVEYPGVKLHCFSEEKKYYSEELDLISYLEQKTFSTLNFNLIAEKNPFVEGTGFKLD